MQFQETHGYLALIFPRSPEEREGTPEGGGEKGEEGEEDKEEEERRVKGGEQRKSHHCQLQRC